MKRKKSATNNEGLVGEQELEILEESDTTRVSRQRAREKNTKLYTCQICYSVCETQTEYVKHVIEHARITEEEDGEETEDRADEEEDEEVEGNAHEDDCNSENIHVEESPNNEEEENQSAEIIDQKVSGPSFKPAVMSRRLLAKNNSRVTCTDCGKIFQTLSHFKIHVNSQCGLRKSYTCDDCGSKFMTVNTLNTHRQIHKGEEGKRFQCKVCGNRFLSKGQLKVHMRKHTGEKPFKCSECPKAFTHRESLVTHSSIHTGIKPYHCVRCDNTFSCIGNLIKHRKARPLSCGLPQYSNKSKIAPRPSTKIPGTMTIKKNDEKGSSDEESNQQVITKKRKRQTEKQSASMSGGVEGSEDDEENLAYANSEEGSAKNEVELENYQSTDPTDQLENNELIDNWECAVEDDSSFQSDLVEQQEEAHDEGQDLYHIKEASDEDAEEKQDIIEVIKIDDKGRIEGNNEFVFMETYLMVKPIEEARSPLQHEEDVIGYHEQILEHDAAELIDIEETNANEDSFQQDDTSKTQPLLMEKVDSVDDVIVDEIFLEFDRDLSEKKSSANVQYSCKFCSKWYYSESKRDDHQRYHGPEGQLTVRCVYCKQFFETAEKMTHHRKTHHSKLLECKICGKILRDPEFLAQHMTEMHSERRDTENQPERPQKQICWKCNKVFDKKIHLAEHLLTTCKPKTGLECPICHKKYANSATLKTHMTCHDNVKPYSCSFCPKLFRTMSQVHVHERVHTGVKPYKCDFCEKSFAHRESLLTHRSIHTGVKRFLCIGCGMRFSCISNLHAHRRTRNTTCGQLPAITKPVSDGSDVK